MEEGEEGREKENKGKHRKKKEKKKGGEHMGKREGKKGIQRIKGGIFFKKS